MGTMKPRGVPVNFDGQERMFLFTLNTIDEIQEETGKTMQEIMEELTEDRGKRETLKYVVMTLLNEEAERAKRKGLEEIPTSVTLQDVGDMVGMDNQAGKIPGYQCSISDGIGIIKGRKRCNCC